MKELLRDSRKRQQFICTYIVYIMNGMLALAVGSLMPYIRDSRGLEYTICGLIVSLHSVGNLISSFFAGPLTMKLGRKKTILLFNICFAIAYVLICFGSGNFTIMLGFLLTGLARGATTNFCNVTVNNLAPGKAWMVNSLHAMFSVGAFAFPLLLTFLTTTSADNWIYAGYFMLAMGILSWILYAIMPVDELAPKKKEEKKTTWDFFKDPMFLFCSGTLFFYQCVEQGVVGWLVTYFKDTGLLAASLSQVMASVQWLMVLAGRLTTAYLSTKVDKSKLLRIMGCGMIIFFVVLITATNTPQIVIGIMGFGFSMAGVYPTTVSFAGNLMQKSPVGWSFVLTIASMGAIIMPSVIGKIAEMAGIVSGMSSIVVVIVIDMVLILALTRYVKRHGAEN